MAVAQVQIVCKALSDADLFGFSGAPSSSAREMVAAAVPHATGDHGYQKEMRAAAGTVLASARAAAEAEIGERREQGEAAGNAISDAQKALAESSASTQQAKLRLEEARAALERQAAKASEAKQEEQRAKQEEELARESKEIVLKRKMAVDSSMASVQAVEDGEQEDLKTDDISSILCEASCEKTLLEAFPTAATVPKAKRGRFDALTLEEVKDVLSGHGTMLQGQLDEAQTLFRDSWAEALGCEALMEVEEERREAASSAVQEAEAVAEAKKAAEASARKLVATREDERSNFLVMQTLAEEKLNRAQEALAALEKLQENVEMPEAPRDEIGEKLADATQAQVMPHSPKLGA
eukprot:TRINITY_DN8457_c0_g1_i1.p1 TRINITY_DN8457_c0_g1~~TRINITY_DN8457_c0_g1_i1.p1  ORF type:complete len:352 (-),score=131.06 TRINITY_DN8457_c0_g1_i1:90-1145(-)